MLLQTPQIAPNEIIPFIEFNAFLVNWSETGVAHWMSAPPIYTGVARRTITCKFSIKSVGLRTWNSLSVTKRNPNCLSAFKRNIRDYLLTAEPSTLLSDTRNKSAGYQLIHDSLIFLYFTFSCTLTALCT